MEQENLEIHDDIKVSVICLAYNHEKYIRECLEGFVTQKTNFAFEVLVHDDASTDGTAEIIREYEQKYPHIIKPIYQTENQYSRGAQISREFLYPKAKGKYIAFCEGDDFWISPYKLQKQIDFLDSNKEYIACICRCMTVDKNSVKCKQLKFGNYENPGVFTINDLRGFMLPGQLGGLVYRNIYFDPKIGYPKSFEKVKFQGDVKLYIWLLTHGDIYRMDETLSAYRHVCEIGGSSWTSRQLTDPKYYEKWKAIREIEKIVKKENKIKLLFHERKLEYALGVVVNLRKGITAKKVVHVCEVLLKQRGALSQIIKHYLVKSKAKK